LNIFTPTLLQTTYDTEVRARR